jgi:hypothetical protein
MITCFNGAAGDSMVDGSAKPKMSVAVPLNGSVASRTDHSAYREEFECLSTELDNG